MIEFKNVSKVYDNGTHALSDVSLSVKPGEFVFVVGASGAGKSTFLKLIMREEVPTSGSIQINNHNLGTMKNKEIPYFRRELGIVFQDFRLIPNMTVYDNIAFAMRVTNNKPKEISKRVPSVISLVGLSAKARCYPRELSGGEQQRVALARAIINNADIIIADEPTGNVDPQMSLEIIELLLSLNEKGKTIILVTHEHSLVRKFKKRVVILENGCIVHDGVNEYEKALKSSQGHIDLSYANIDNTHSVVEKNLRNPEEFHEIIGASVPDSSVAVEAFSESAKALSDAEASALQGEPTALADTSPTPEEIQLPEETPETPTDIQSFLDIPDTIDFEVYRTNDDDDGGDGVK